MAQGKIKSLSFLGHSNMIQVGSQPVMIWWPT